MYVSTYERLEICTCARVYVYIYDLPSTQIHTALQLYSTQNV